MCVKLNSDLEVKKKLFEGKYCKLELVDKFVLRGTVISIEENGIIFETSTKTSFIGWRDIFQLVPEEF